MMESKKLYSLINWNCAVRPICCSKKAHRSMLHYGRNYNSQPLHDWNSNKA